MNTTQPIEHSAPSARDAERTSASTRPRAAMARGATVLIATAAGLLGWVVARIVLDVTLVVETGTGAATWQVGAGAVVLAGLVVGLAAWLLLSVLERVTSRPRGVWTVVALVVLALSLTGPLAGTTGTVVTVLMGLHVLVAAVLVVGMRRTV